MCVKERVMSIRLLNKIENNREYSEQIGVTAGMRKRNMEAGRERGTAGRRGK